MTILIDAGNTLVKSASVRRGRAFRGGELRTSSLTEKKMMNLLRGARACVCCSVVPRATAMLKKISRRQNIKVHFVSHRDIKGVRLKYDKPATIGADRIASVLGALAESAPPFIIVDMGSAVTCELVDKNASYRGGLIFPGIELSLGALKTGCALLPGASFSRPRPGPGTSTRECIRKGVWAAVSGGIEKAVSAFLAAEPAAAVFLTGSGSRFARPGDFSFRYRRKPDLVFDGLLQFCGKLV